MDHFNGMRLVINCWTLSLNAVQNSWIGVSNDECDMFTHKHHVRFFPYVDFPSHRVVVCGADLGDNHQSNKISNAWEGFAQWYGVRNRTVTIT